jgi:hypothetical protein
MLTFTAIIFSFEVESVTVPWSVAWPSATAGSRKSRTGRIKQAMDFMFLGLLMKYGVQNCDFRFRS